MLSLFSNKPIIKSSPLEQMIEQYHFLSRQINKLEQQLNEINIGDFDIMYHNIEIYKKTRANLYQQIKMQQK